MTEDYRTEKLDELGRLLHDPSLPIRPVTIWNLLDEIIRAQSASRGGFSELARQAGSGEMGA
jgi:hypothetical protein